MQPVESGKRSIAAKRAYHFEEEIMSFLCSRRARVLVPLLLVLIALALPVAQTSQAQTGGTVSYGSIVFGALSETTPTLTYSFAGSAGDLVTVDVIGLSGGLNPSVTLLDPNQQAIVVNDTDACYTSAQDAHFSRFLRQNGTHAIVVGSADGSTGDFMLRLQGRPPVVASVLQYDQPVTVNIPQNPTPQYFSFDVKDCPTTLTVLNPGPGQPFTFPFVVRVRNQEGESIALLRGGEAIEDRVTLAPNSGHYQVDVLSDDPTVAGLITLLLTCGADAPGCVGDTITTTISGGPGGPGGEDGYLECPPCLTGDDDIPLDGNRCVDDDLTATLVDPASKSIRAVFGNMSGPDITYRLIYHLVHGDGSFVHGSITFSEPGEYVGDFSYLPDEYLGMRIVMEIWQGDTIICVDDELVMWGDFAEPECEDFRAGITEHHYTWAMLEWGSYPGAEGYVITMRTEAGAVAMSIIVPASQHSMRLEPAPGTYEVVVGPWTSDAGLFCERRIMVIFDQAPPDEPVTDDGEDGGVPAQCSIQLLAPREGMANGLQTFYWTAVSGASGYRLMIYNESDVMVAEVIVDAATTSATLDVSTAAIGPGLSFFTVVEALREGFTWCADGVYQYREVEEPYEGEIMQPEVEPYCGDGICNGDETGNSCQADCMCNFNGICEPLRDEAPSNCSDCP
jgi:hypothetical protein